MVNWMLKLSNLNSFYGEVQVLRDVALEVNQGEIVTLIGANAAGKSTLISCISRTVTSFDGIIEFEGSRIDHLRPDQVVDHGLIQVPEGRLLCSQSLQSVRIWSLALTVSVAETIEKRDWNMYMDFSRR